MKKEEERKMLVFEYRSKVKLKKDLPYEKTSESFAYFIDSALGLDEHYLQFHKQAGYKYYVYDMLYPIEKDGIYKKGKIYTVRIRTVKQDLAEYFSDKLPFHNSEEFQGKGGELRIIPKKMLERIYSVTPILQKNNQGYWKGHMRLAEFEERLKVNLIKKYKCFTGEELDEDFALYDLIEFKNTKPVKMVYKGIHLLGDKISFQIASNETAQMLAYFALGVGICDNNARGAGFVNYRYL